jgi:malate dehydrogenase (oxaloacetate-decarboxylating)(NADP+)
MTIGSPAKKRCYSIRAVVPAKSKSTQQNRLQHSVIYRSLTRRMLRSRACASPGFHRRLLITQTRGNLVAVISNGSAVLGLGAIGALASKPVMEGKAALYKRFADVDAIDHEVDTTDVDQFVNFVRLLKPSFGGINLEDIKAPECFIIEQRLHEVMNIPVFRDDQHSTAIIASAGLINALYLTGHDISKTRIVVNGAGATAIACVELIKAMGVAHDNVVMCYSHGAIYQGREDGINQWKSAHAANTKARTLAEAVDGANIFFGRSHKDYITTKMVAGMRTSPSSLRW